jgi:hypothetical protein
MKSSNENLLNWKELINERIQSGMKVEDWCKKNNISKHKYYYWHHKIKKQENTEGVEFANITPNFLNNKEINNVPIPSCDFQVLYKGIQVTVPDKFNPDALAGLLKVLQGL